MFIVKNLETGYTEGEFETSDEAMTLLHRLVGFIEDYENDYDYDVAYSKFYLYEA